ncbi:putative phosphoinositide phosphatase SAC9 [Histomonas meleagridis]|uniref:putative phosphoinositide phosphatase SAC9 n=1 Tax=Histomonas meleagridis TaxID=135588 RepID=UPI00355A1A4D|nr:putative phosphoinositide phosphatase SAC9 [Histomonas meleagridis]KAH0807054.1 putative phosphoinositide phosphatase SAC9 [Histomonas meleagridis]
MVENADHSYVLCFVTATKTTCKIPGGAIVKKVTDVSYITITLNGYQVGSEFSDFTVAHFHYYCDTYDITNCYPNNNDPNLPSPEFCWNRRWRQIFEELDLSFLCIVLLQGYTSTLTFDQYNISYIVRRSVLNPGVRYFARGLNDVDSPGNEVECELLFAKLDQPDEFWEHCWRRGSVPFYWETILSGASARIHINSNFCQGTIHYFQHLRKRFNNSTIFLLSLLQYSAKNPNAPENELYLQYQQTVAELLREGIDYVTFYPFDLNEKFSTEGKGGVVDLLSYLSPLAILSDFTTHERKQAGLLRVNCADSLDRTNLATFYYALLITAEWCRRVSLAKSNNIPFSPEKPDQYIPPTILDFLAKAFVGSGDSIIR